MNTRILVTPDYPSSAAADLAPAYETPSSAGPLELPARTDTAASVLAGLRALISAAKRCRAAMLRALAGEIQVSISQRRRGFVKGLRCNVCHEAIHDDTEMCPRQWAGLCAICGPVLLDYYGHGLAPDCDPRRGHTISRRHKATRAEWMRSRFAVLKPSPISRGAR